MNTDIYTCRHCDYTGPAYVNVEWERRDSMYDRHPTLEAVEVRLCADCGSSHIEEAILCDTCGEHPAAPHMDDCEDCIEAREAEQDAIVDRVKELEGELADEYLP